MGLTGNTKAKAGKPLFLLAVITFMGTFSTASFGVGTEKNEVEKGYSSSYLPIKSGPLVNEEYKTPENDVLDLNTKKMSVAERFDKSRRGTLGQDFDLYSFFKDIGHNDKAEHWEGKCHQWSAGANDKNIKPLINASKGILCQGLDGKGIVLEAVDLKELITATYPSRTMELSSTSGQYAFFGGRENKNPNQEAPINELDHAMKDSMGITDFSPALFHDKIHHYLKSGQGVVLDVDPREEVWNQPVHSADSGVADEGDLPSIPTRFLEATAPTAQGYLTTVNEINSVFFTLLSKTNKKDKDKASEIILANSMGSSISPTLIEQIKQMEKDNASLGTVVEGLVRLKNESFQSAKKEGIKIKDGLKIKRVNTMVEYLVETHFRGEGTPTRQKNYYYHMVENNAGDTVYSQWVGPNNNHARPDFLWVPSCQSETCDADASNFRGFFKNLSDPDKVNYEGAGLTIGLSDLLKLMKDCFPLDKAMEVAGRLANNMSSVKNLWEMGEDAQKEMAADYKTIKESKIPVRIDSIKKLMTMPGLTLDGQNNLSMVDWNAITLDCQETKGGVTTKVDKSRCMGDPKEGKFEKWGLFAKECWESTGGLFNKKWIRRVPPKLCGISDEEGGINLGPIRLGTFGSTLERIL